MTKDMPVGGKLSLDMMYKTAGTQLNLDYTSEEDFIKKFKLANNLVPISIGLFANSSIVEKSNSGYLSYRSKVWQEKSRGGLPEFFLKEVNFEKYADYIMNYPILFLQSECNYISGKKYLFKNFMNGEIKEIGNKIPSTNDLDTHLGTIFTENQFKAGRFTDKRAKQILGMFGIDEKKFIDIFEKYDKKNARKIVPKISEDVTRKVNLRALLFL